MPFARVGAMPPPPSDAQQSTEQNSNNGRARNSRQKGITMEDLKKQTALRLAQEQKHQGVPLNTMATAYVQQSIPMATPQSHHYARPHHHASSGFTAVHRDPAPPQHYHAPRHNSTGHPAASEAAGGSHHTGSSSGNFQQPFFSKNFRKKCARQMASSSSPVGAALTASHSMYQQQAQHSGYAMANNPGYESGVMPINSPAPAASHDATGDSSHQQSGNSKLPHGLTVHELKEMTKARLQAEAAEKVPYDPNAPTSVTDTMSAESDAPESRATTSDSRRIRYGLTVADLQQRTAESRSAVPTTVHAQSLSVEQGNRQPPQVSPLPPGFQNYRPNFSPFNESGVYDQNRSRNRDSFQSDTNWETASVTSHNSTVASDYLGSESPFPSGVASFAPQVDDSSGMPLGRTQSYPTVRGGQGSGDSPAFDSQPSSINSPLVSYYGDASQSRQRAMTLSPRPGGLSLLHEDRPGFIGDDLAMPSFSSTSRRQQQLPARARRSFSPVISSQGLSTDNFGGFGSNFGGVISEGAYEGVANRERTSSAVSLPAISHTAEEFALDFNGSTSSGRSSGNQGGLSIKEEESFLESSSLYSSGDGGTSGANSVFRDNTSFGVAGIAPPPGLSGGHGSALHSADSFGEKRARASTWVAGCDMFGATRGLMECSGDDTLAGDLASILKLSGAEERPDRDRSESFPGFSGSVFGSSENNFPSSSRF